MKLTVIELFGGIGACTAALERIGIDVEIVDYVEIDKYAVKSFNAIHSTDFEPQDITKWDKDLKCDLIMHGSPCQDFSVAGLGRGGDEGSGTRSSLMYETIRIVKKIRPKYVIWENVKNLLSKKHRHNFDAYIEAMNELGYTSYYQVLNTKDYGIPQNRERVFTISIRNDLDILFEFPEKMPLKLRMKDLLEDEVDDKYYITTDKAKTLIDKLLLDGKLNISGGWGRQSTSLSINRSKETLQTVCQHGQTEVSATDEPKEPECVRSTVYMNYNRIDRVDTDVAKTLMARDYKGFNTGFDTQNGVVECQKSKRLEIS